MLISSWFFAAALLGQIDGPRQRTLPFPAGPYLAPLADTKSATPRRGIVIVPGDTILPQIANSGSPEGSGFLTYFQFVNVSKFTATLRIEFFDSSGNPMDIPIVDDPNTFSSRPARGFGGVLPAGSYGAQTTIPDGSPTAIGYAMVDMQPAESVAVNAAFMQFIPGRPLFMAGIPLSSILHKTAFMPYASDGGFTSSLALVSVLSQEVTLIARAPLTGGELCRTSIRFSSGQHRSFLLRDVLSCTSQGEGSLEIRGDPFLPGGITGIGFMAHDEGAFVTQPIWTNLERIQE